ncbi:MAG: hypothetical protein IJ358_02785 [Clostridia bacterium]|nr:hypothetical protein [Clostridia bacterium]
MSKTFYQCEHCIHFLQHYVICEDMIHQTSCGHCTCRDKDFKIRKIDCKYFEQRTEMGEKIKKEERALYVLKQVNKMLNQLKLYLYNNEPSQKIDKCMLERFKR